MKPFTAKSLSSCLMALADQLLFLWLRFDQDGMQMQTSANSSLNIITLEGKESKYISAVAPSMNCNVSLRQAFGRAES